MSKKKAGALKSYHAGHIKIRIMASAYQCGDDITASVAVDLALTAAKAFHAEVGAVIEVVEAKLKADQEREARRKAWRDREVAAGRMKIMNWGDK